MKVFRQALVFSLVLTVLFLLLGQVSVFAQERQDLRNMNQDVVFADDFTSEPDIILLGLQDEEHLLSHGGSSLSPSSSAMPPNGIHPTGTIGGSAIHWDGENSEGRSGWVFDGNETHRVGLENDEHTDSDGERDNQVRLVNASGQGAGTASRFSEENGDIGRSTWVWDGSDTVRIGLTDEEHTRGSTGEQDSRLEAIKDEGHVLGRSDTFDEDSWTGFSTWIYDGEQTIRIGFYSEDFLDEDGGPKARPRAMNNVGEAAGISQAYRDTDNGKSTFGERAWLYRDDETIALGFTDDEHRNTEPGHDHFGRMESEPFAINDDGQVIGNSRRYDEASTTGSRGAHGMSAWIYDIEAEIHTRIGFTDATHTGDDGFQDSSILGGSEIRPLNQSGQVIGRSRRFIADHWQERTAWLYDSETDSLQRLGLTGGDYIDDDGFESSIARVLNEAGYVVGRSWVVSDGRDGRDVWLFDGDESLRIGLYDDLHTSSTDDRNNNMAWNHFVLNESAQVVGWADQYDGDEATGQSGWFYDHNEKKTHELIFEIPESGTGHTIPEVVFENGLVRGRYTRYSDGGFQQESHEFLWTVDNGFFTIDDLLTEDLDTDGVEWLELRSMRWMLNDGSIVGYGRVSDEDADRDRIQPFLLRTVNY